MIDFRSTSEGVTIEGPLWSKDVPQSIRRRMMEAVETIAESGADEVRRALMAGIRSPTGFTAAGIEGFSYRHGWYTSGSLYGKVRMKADLQRGPSGGKYPPARVPYIVLHTLEGGGYGGRRLADSSRMTGRRGRSRTNWERGSRHNRRALHAFRNVARVMRRQAALVRTDLTRDLE